MPVAYSIDSDLGILRIVAHGTPSAQDQLELARRWSDDPEFIPGMSILLDNRGRSAPSSPDHVQEMADLAHESPFLAPGTRCAVVVGSEAEYGMTRMFSMLSEEGPMQTQVFREVSDAERWLKSGE